MHYRGVTLCPCGMVMEANLKIKPALKASIARGRAELTDRKSVV